MKSITNLLLFLASVALLAMCFVAVNVFVKRLSLDDLSKIMRAESSAESRGKSSLDSANRIKNAESRGKIAESNTKSRGKIAESWSAIFAKKEVPHYRYPVPEMFLALDFSPKSYTDILQISNLDEYKFFCLKEILKSNNIKFTYKIVRQKATLEIALDSANREKLFSDLARYNIHYNLIKG